MFKVVVKFSGGIEKFVVEVEVVIFSGAFDIFFTRDCDFFRDGFEI